MTRFWDDLHQARSKSKDLKAKQQRNIWGQ
jgi:hypothetical protein